MTSNSVSQLLNKLIKNRKILLSIIDSIKTIGKMGVPLRGHWDGLRQQPNFRELANHPGLVISLVSHQCSSSTGKPNFGASFEDS